MDEQKTKEKTEEPKTEDPKTNNDAGDKYETTPIIERAREERERMEKATEAQKAENDRTEKIMVRKAMGGQSEAGTVDKTQTEDEKKKQGAKEFFKGTELESAIDKL